MTANQTIEQREIQREEDLELAFLPLHKSAFGTATALTAGLVVLAVTLIHMQRAEDPFPLALLAQYYYGYSVSLAGAAIGFFWTAVVGFVVGWLFAFTRNLALAAMLFVIRTRAELAATRDFLDHI